MTFKETQKLIQSIFRLLKVQEIIIPIGRTNKGNLGIKFSESSNDFEMMLDSVPLSTKDSLNDENNIELKTLITNFFFEEEKAIRIGEKLGPINEVTGNLLINQATGPKKRGRPKKIK